MLLKERCSLLLQIQIQKVQRVFTKHIDGMHDLSYTESLKSLQIYSLQRQRDRYMDIYIWKILEGNVPNFSPPIKCHISARRGRLGNNGVVPTGHLGTLCHNSFRSKAATIFNCLPKHIRNLVNCADTSIFKRQKSTGLSFVFNRGLSYGLWYRMSATVSPLSPKKMQ